MFYQVLSFWGFYIYIGIITGKHTHKRIDAYYIYIYIFVALASIVIFCGPGISWILSMGPA